MRMEKAKWGHIDPALIVSSDFLASRLLFVVLVDVFMCFSFSFIFSFFWNLVDRISLSFSVGRPRLGLQSHPRANIVNVSQLRPFEKYIARTRCRHHKDEWNISFSRASRALLTTGSDSFFKATTKASIIERSNFVFFFLFSLSLNSSRSSSCLSCSLLDSRMGWWKHLLLPSWRVGKKIRGVKWVKYTAVDRLTSLPPVGRSVGNGARVCLP